MIFPKLDFIKKKGGQTSGKIIISLCELSYFNLVWIFVILWTIAHQAPLSIGFSRQETWDGLPCLPPGNLPNLRTEPASVYLYTYISGSSVRGISQAKILEWFAIFFSRRPSRCRDWAVIYIGRQILNHWAIRKALPQC